MPEGNLIGVLQALHSAGLEFIVVGGVAAALQGVPGQTLEFDVVLARHASNLQRLQPVLDSIHAVFRINRNLKPSASHLSGIDRLNLLTDFGPLDVLCTIDNNLGYEDLLPDSIEMDIGGGIRIRVLSLEKLIEIKEQVGGEKDLAVLPILRRTLEERNQARKSAGPDLL